MRARNHLVPSDNHSLCFGCVRAPSFFISYLAEFRLGVILKTNMSESKRPLRMTGEEIHSVFGNREILNMETEQTELSSHIDALREVMAESWEDEEVVAKTQSQIDELEEKLRALREKMREKRKGFGETIERAKNPEVST